MTKTGWRDWQYLVMCSFGVYSGIDNDDSGIVLALQFVVILTVNKRKYFLTCVCLSIVHLSLLHSAICDFMSDCVLCLYRWDLM